MIRRAVDKLLDTLMRHTENCSCLPHGHIRSEERGCDTAAGERRFGSSDAFDHVSIVEEFLHTLEVWRKIDHNVYVDIGCVGFEKVNDQAPSNILDFG